MAERDLVTSDVRTEISDTISTVHRDIVQKYPKISIITVVTSRNLLSTVTEASKVVSDNLEISIFDLSLNEPATVTTGNTNYCAIKFALIALPLSDSTTQQYDCSHFDTLNTEYLHNSVYSHVEDILSYFKQIPGENQIPTQNKVSLDNLQS